MTGDRPVNDPSSQLTEEGADVANQFVGGFHCCEVTAVVDVGPTDHVVLPLEERAYADVVGELDERGGYRRWLRPVAPVRIGVADEGRASCRAGEPVKGHVGQQPVELEMALPVDD